MLRREQASQSAYDKLKAAILHGELSCGRLDIQILADRLRVSPTPVREALARLATERLIDFSPRHGYAFSTPSPDTLRDLYAWSGQLIHLSLGAARIPKALVADAAASLPWRSKHEAEETRYARDVSVLLFEIAKSQPSQEIADKVVQANDRLFRARMCEPGLLADAHETLSELSAMWRQADLARLPDQLAAYHRARIARAVEISEMLA